MGVLAETPGLLPASAPVADVEAVLRWHVDDSRRLAVVEAATENGSVPIVVVPAEVVGPSGVAMALQAAVNLRG